MAKEPKKFDGDSELRDQFKKQLLGIWNTYQQSLKNDNMDDHIQSIIIAEMRDQEMNDSEIVCELMNNEYEELKMLWPRATKELEWGRADVNAVMIASKIENENQRQIRVAEMKQDALNAQARGE